MIDRATVTAFITTVGSPLLRRCIESVEAQCAVEVIKNIAPMAAAKQRMVELCKSEFFILVSEDMALYPWAVDALVGKMREAASSVVMIAAPLMDLDLGKPIYGLKIWRHRLVRKVPFVSHPDGDRHDRERLAAAGYDLVKLPRVREQCLGEHGPSTSPEEAFTRWRRLWQRHRRTGAQSWIEPWMEKLRERAGRSRIDLFAFMGAVIGSTEKLWPDDFDPYDFRIKDSMLEQLLERFPR